MKRIEQDRLLGEIFDGPELSDLRQVSLEQGLAAIRRRRQRRRVTRVCALALLPLLLIPAFWPKKASEGPERPAAYASAPQAPPPPHYQAAPIKFISDEQLLAFFPDRAVALI